MLGGPWAREGNQKQEAQICSLCLRLYFCKSIHQYPFSRFHIQALIYDIFFLFLTYFTMCEVGSYVPSIHPHHYKCPNFVPFYGWVFHCISLYIVYCIFHCICGKLPYFTGSSAPFSVMTSRGGRGGWVWQSLPREGGDICIGIADSLCLQQKLTQHCKAIVLQLKTKREVRTSFPT